MNELQIYLSLNIKRLTDDKKKLYLTENNDFIYRTKLEECNAYEIGHNLEDYPFIKAENEEYKDQDITTTINRIIDAYNLSIEKLSQIERYRRRAILQLGDCSNFSEAEALLAELIQNLNLV